MRPELLEKQERSVLIVRFLRGALLRQVVKTRTGPSDEDHPISLPATASQRPGLSATGAGSQTPQVAGTGSYPLEWTSNGPESNSEGGTTRGGKSVAPQRGAADP